MIHVNHITLTTGHMTRSSRAEVGDETLAVMAPWLARLVAHGEALPLPVAALQYYSARGYTNGGGLVITVYGAAGPYAPGKQASADLPLITLGIAQRSRHGGELWAKLLANFGGKPGIKQPGTPWCAVALHPTLAMHIDASHWLGDFERCLAWAWITRTPHLEVAGKEAPP